MSLELNVSETIANADAQVAMTQVGLGATSIPCSYCKGLIVGAEYAELVAAMEGKPLVIGSPDAMCEGCASADPATATALNAAFAASQPPAVDDMAKLKAEHEAMKAKLAAIELAETQAEYAKVKAENDKIKAKLAAKEKGKEKPVATAPTAPTATAPTATAKPEKTPQVVGPQDIALGVIDPKYHTKRDMALLSLIHQERTKPEQMKVAGRIPGTYSVKVFGILKEAKYSQAWIEAMMVDALNRNVISHMWIRNTKTGKKMVLLFDTAWRPNIVKEWDRLSDDEISDIRAAFGE